MNPLGVVVILIGLLLIATGWTNSQGRIFSLLSGL